MSSSLCIEKAKPSQIKRLSILPRFGFTVDFAGRQLVYRQAPILETVFNVWDRGFSMKNFMDVALTQLREIAMPTLQVPACDAVHSDVTQKTNIDESDCEKGNTKSE